MKRLICCFGIHRHYSDKLKYEFELKPEFKHQFLWCLNQHVPFERFKNLELSAFVSEQVKQESFDRLEILVWEQMNQEFDFWVHINFYDMVNLLESTIETTHWVAGASEPWTLDQELYFHDLIERTTCPTTFEHRMAYYRIKTLFQFAARAAVKSKVSWREAYVVLIRVLCSAQCQLLPVFYPYALSRGCITIYGYKNKKPTVFLRLPFSPMLKPQFQPEFGLGWVTANKIVKQRAIKMELWSRFKPVYVSHEEALYIGVTSARSTLQMESHRRPLERLDRRWSKKSKT